MTWSVRNGFFTHVPAVGAVRIATLTVIVGLFAATDVHARVGTWTAISGGPSPRHSHAAAAGGGRVLVFGGQSGTTPLGDTWLLLGTTWTPITATSNDPTPRYGAAMVYDSDHDRFVLFGGTDGTSTLDTATYVFDGGWFKQSGAGPARYYHGMAYDNQIDHAVLLWGGVTGPPDNNVWKWNGVSWSSFTPTGTPPTQRRSPGFVYDAGNKRVVMYGGLVPPFSTVDDCWQLKGGGWLALNNGCTLQTRAGHSIAYDPRQRGILLFGGKVSMSYFGDTKLLQTGGTFTDLILTNLPPSERADHTLVYDDSRGRFILIGGQDVAGDRADVTHALSIAGNPCPPESCAEGLTCKDEFCCSSSCTEDCYSCDGLGSYLKPEHDGVCRQNPTGENPDCHKEERDCWGTCNDKGKCVFDKGNETPCGKPANCLACNIMTGKCDVLPQDNYDPDCNWPKGQCSLASHSCRIFSDPPTTPTPGFHEPRLCEKPGACRAMKWSDCRFENGPGCPKSCKAIWCK